MKNTQRNRKTQRAESPCPSLPWWRLGPCILAIGLLFFIPKANSPDAGNSPKRIAGESITPATYQASEDSPPAKLTEESTPDFSALEGNPLEGGENMEKKLAAANEMVTALTPADWLGPLAPIAMSPFFGITCLSGLAIWGPDWFPGAHLLQSATPLKNETIFWSFAVLTVLTSLPRLSKVSKPIAQAADKLEAYAGIITILVIRYMATAGGVEAEPGDMMEAGILSSSLNSLLYVAMVINVLVINSVKFFFEFMIWLTPIPFLDACFEVANKSICGALMALYAYSPTLATLVNLTTFVLCALALRWISRRIKFYRTLAFDPLLSMISSSAAKPEKPELIVFPEKNWLGFQDRAKLTLSRNDDGFTVRQDRWFMPSIEKTLDSNSTLEIKKGWISNTLVVSGPDAALLTFSRKHQKHLGLLTEMLSATLEQSQPKQQATVTA